MRKTTGILLALGLIMAAAAGWWFASPWWALRQMRDAAAAKDVTRLSAYVDYPALRADLKGDVARQLLGTRSVAAGSVERLVAATIAGPLIDAMVTPQGVAAMFAADTTEAERDGAADDPRRRAQLPRAPTQNAEVELDRNGFDEFSVRPSDSSGGTLLFRRAGLGWRLAGVDLAPARVEGGRSPR